MNHGFNINLTYIFLGPNITLFAIEIPQVRKKNNTILKKSYVSVLLALYLKTEYLNIQNNVQIVHVAIFMSQIIQFNLDRNSLPYYSVPKHLAQLNFVSVLRLYVGRLLNFVLAFFTISGKNKQLLARDLSYIEYLYQYCDLLYF